jgi:hypothetical protein
MAEQTRLTDAGDQLAAAVTEWRWKSASCFRGSPARFRSSEPLFHANPKTPQRQRFQPPSDFKRTWRAEKSPANENHRLRVQTRGQAAEVRVMVLRLYVNAVVTAGSADPDLRMVAEHRMSPQILQLRSSATTSDLCAR